MGKVIGMPPIDRDVGDFVFRIMVFPLESVGKWTFMIGATMKETSKRGIREMFVECEALTKRLGGKYEKQTGEYEYYEDKVFSIVRHRKRLAMVGKLPPL